MITMIMIKIRTQTTGDGGQEEGSTAILRLPVGKVWKFVTQFRWVGVLSANTGLTNDQS